MTEEIYYRQLDALSRDIKHGKINKVLEKLDELYEWKPVRLRWFLVRAEALSAMGQWEESHEMLKNRYDFTYEDSDAISYLNWYKKWRKAENDSSGEELCSFLQDLIKEQEAKDSSLLQQAYLTLQEAEVKWLEAPPSRRPL
jgi:predicted Zn-dependent protease